MHITSSNIQLYTAVLKIENAEACTLKEASLAFTRFQKIKLLVTGSTKICSDTNIHFLQCHDPLSIGTPNTPLLIDILTS